MDDNRFYDSFDDNLNFKEEILRYFSFWPYLLVLLLSFFLVAFAYLRYTAYTYETTSLIEIIDEAQDSEMALPTELTVFNRSMINLENEINILKSYDLNSKVVGDLKSNVLHYTVGSIKTSLVDEELWFDDYNLSFKVDTKNIESIKIFTINVDDGKLFINEFDESEDNSKLYRFNSLTTASENHNLPFELSIKSDKNITSQRLIKLVPVEYMVNQIRSKLSVNASGIDSDQLVLKLVYENPKISEKYLNGLMNAFDEDGISDRQLEYQRTIKFVDERELILKKELEVIELRKQNFKKSNNLSDLSVDAGNNIDLKYTYNSEIFQVESQMTIANFLLESLNDKSYDYLPINIGLDDFDLNNMILEYNKIVTERNRYLTEAGPNNILVKSTQTQLDSLINNISTSIKNYLNSIELKITNLKAKELEFENVYSRVPENEKILRSIERELSIKEALYLLLLQKKEEAAINLAVVKPSIKIIDYPITNLSSKSPKSYIIYLVSFLIAVAIYFFVLFIWFFLDNKVHHKEQLSKKLDNNIPIICEIPFIDGKGSLSLNSTAQSRSVLAEGIRMLVSNLRFTSPNFDDSKNCKSVLFTSSIKGEGKTLASVNTALNLAHDLKKDKKVILLGTDLRNPQIHKSFGVEKNQKGISEIIYKNDFKNYNSYIKKFDNLDVLFSGAIPPNPTSLLSSETFQNLLTELKKDYDYIIIDSAPCLLVSDTFQFINLVDSVVYIFRANFTDSKIIDYINEIYESGKAKNLNLVLNAVGNSASYGYKYGYQYGYKYGYKYSYNYGYGYGYTSSD